MFARAITQWYICILVSSFEAQFIVRIWLCAVAEARIYSIFKKIFSA
jgi:hypothetical protein